MRKGFVVLSGTRGFGYLPEDNVDSIDGEKLLDGRIRETELGPML